jgi:hypothetical protein
MESWISFGALIVGALGISIGLYQYWIAQRWKVAEFVAQEVKGFEDDKIIQDAMLILDYEVIKMPLAIDEGKGEEYRIAHGDLISALRKHKDNEERFDDKEFALRMTFDHFLALLGRFNHYINARLVRKHHLDPYLSYWMNALAGKGLVEPGAAKAIRAYAKAYGFDDLTQLLTRYQPQLREELN